jgi:hypothetical protein
MASANWTQAAQLQAEFPHTYTAMEHLIMAMADAYNKKGKTSIFGYDKGLKSYLKFEEKLKNTLVAMAMDGVVNRVASAKEYHDKLILIIDAWQLIFPNWPDAYGFAYEKLRVNPKEARQLIAGLVGVRH